MNGLSRGLPIAVILILLVSVALVSAPATAQTDGVDLTDKDTMALESLNIDIEPSSISGAATNGADGQLRYQVELTGKIHNDNYPILYPVRVEYYDVTDYQGNINDPDDLLDNNLDGVTRLGADATFLTPTQPDTFPPGSDTGPFENRQMAEIYNTTLNFEDLFEIDDDEVVQKEVVTVLNSTRSVDQTMDRSTDSITGPLPSGVSDGFVSKSADTDTPSAVSFVDNYRISEDRQNPQFGEDLAIPSPGYTDLRGQINSFSSMSRPLQGLSTVTGGENGISFNTLTSSIPTGSPHTLVITYNITQGDEVTVNPINPAGDQVEQSTEYNLPRDASDSPSCREISVDSTDANACIFYLDQGEIESINELGEMIVHYQSDERTEIGVGCQSLISGYLPVDKQACGVNPFGSGPNADQDPLLSLTIEGQAGPESELEPEEWQVDEVAVPSRPDVDEEPHHIRSDVSGNIQQSDYNGDIELRIYDDSQIEFNEDGRTIKNGEDPLETLNVGNFESGSWEEINNVGEAPTLEVTEYTAILCNTGDDSCDVGDRGNIDEDTVTFVPPQIDGELIINEPVTINPLPIEDESDTFVTRTERVETIDDDFADNTDWERVGQVATDFDGTITQIVTLRNRGEAQANTARVDNNVIQDAEDRLSDIESNSWDHTVSVSQISSGEAYVPQSKQPSDYNDNGIAFPGDNWRSATTFDSREVQTGTESQNFPLVTDSSFASQVESQERWYPLRDQSGSRSSTEYVLDNVLRYEDPDNCLNCLPPENSTQAEKRLNQSVGGLTRVVETPNTDVWNKVDDEPLIRNGDEINASFYRRGQTVGNTLFYQNLGSSVPDDKIYRHRNSNKSNVQLYEWEYAPEILEVPFGKPTTQQTQRYVNNRYNIVYTFTSNIQNPSTLYAYEKDVERPDIEYEKGHIAWLDISPSDSEEFYQYQVQYEGADDPVTVRWSEDIHGVAPHDRNAEVLEQECQESISNHDGNNPVTMGPADIVEENDDLVYAEGRHGNGGKVVLQKCTIDGEERIVRVGVEYTEPGSFSFDVDVTGLSPAEGEKTGINTVVPEGQDEDDRFEDGGPESSPNLDNIEPINEKVDFRVGIAAFQGNIFSSTHHLDKEYEVTVTPADDIDAGSVTCGEFDGYRSYNNIEVTQTFLSGDSFREEEQCIREGFVEPSEAPPSFVLERKGYNFDTRDEEPNSDDLVYEEAFDIPQGAIQSCEPPLEEDDSGQCFAQTEAIDPDPSDNNNIINEINFGSADGGWSPVGAHNDTVPPIGNQCPLGYESSVDRNTDNDNYDLLLETTCSLDGDLSIDLRSRLINVEYETVSSGIIEECSNIVSAGEDRTHDGYSDRRPGDDGIEHCEKNDQNDPGPSNFVLYEDTQDPVTQETERSPNNVPAGAFRGVSLSDEQAPSVCASTRTEDDGSLICEFDPNGDGDSQEIRYGVVEYGSWTSTSQRSSDLVDQAQSRKSVWRGEVVIPVNDDQSTSTTEWNEPFTTVINPRDIGVSLESLEDNTVEFTFELRETDTSEVVGTEQVEVKLCESTSVGSVDQLPRDVKGENECDDFDSVMTGYDDWQIGKAGQNANSGEVVEDVEEAIDDYADTDDLSSRGPQDYVIESIANDACPYTHEYPRDQQSLVENPDTYTYTIDADNSNQLSAEQDRIERAIYNRLGGQYSVNGDPCSGSLADFGSPPTPIRESEDISVTFDKYSFTSGIRDHTSAGRDFTRIAGLSDLHQNTLNPVQSRWSQDDLGGAIRLGTPVLLDQAGTVGPGRSTPPEQNEANEGLVAHYPFDHDPTEHITYTEISGGAFGEPESETTIPNHYIVQDVGLTETYQSPDGTETTYQYDLLADSDTSSRGIYNSRIWYGSTCHRGPDGTRSRGYVEGQVFSPDSLQPVTEAGPETNARHTSFEGCSNVLVSEGAKEISEYDYVTNPWGERYANLPSHLRFSNPSLNNDIQRLTASVPSDQAAYLPVSPSYQGAGVDTYDNNDWRSEYDVSGGQINDAYESLQENYVEGRGVFGGNALRLNQDSWLMVTPPCYKNDDIGEDLDDVALSNVIGGGSADSSCQQSEDPDPGDTWRGGWAESYTDPENQLSFSSIHNRIEDDYTISFWINTEQAREGLSNEFSSSYNARNIAPIDTFYSTSKPVTNNYEISDTESLMTTNQLSTLRVPQRIDITDIDNSELPGVDSDQSYVSPPAWDYPAHYNLRDTARACMDLEGLSIDRSSYPFPTISIDDLLDDSERPMMCHIFEASDNENVDGSWNNLKNYDRDDIEGPLREPVFLEQFRREMINHRIEWANRYDWAPGSSVESADSGVASDDDFPNYGFNNQYRSPRLTTDSSCEFATQRGCYEDGRYIHGSGVPGGNYMSKTDEALGASGWQHVAISNTEDGLSIYINGEKENKLQASSDGTLATNAIIDENEEVEVGRLHDDGVVSIGAMYQGAGYNFNPDDPGGELGDYVPYIHSSIDTVMIDELRIYNESTSSFTPFSESKVEAEVPELKPPERHGLHPEADLYTGEFVTDDAQSLGKDSSLSSQLDDAPQELYTTWEVEVNATSEGPAAYQVEIIPCENQAGRANCAETASQTVSKSNVPDGLGDRATPGSIDDDFDFDFTYPSDRRLFRLASSGNVEDQDSGRLLRSIIPPEEIGGISGAGQSNEEIYEQSKDISVDGIRETITFNRDKIADAEMERIDSFKFEFKLGTPFVDSTPVVRDVTLRPKNDPYQDCQGLARDHPGSEGLYGAEFRVNLIDQTAKIHEAECDMTTAGGEWTKFAWLDQTNGGEFNKDIGGDPNGIFLEDRNRADCDLDEDNACFANADIDFQSVPRDEKPQILIKSIDEGEVVNWAAFELDEETHKVIENNLGQNEVPVAEEIEEIFDGDPDPVKDETNPFDMKGPSTSSTVNVDGDNIVTDQFSGGDRELYPKCLHPFDTSAEFDDLRCVSHALSVPGGGVQDVATTRLSEYSQTSSGTSTKVDVLNAEVDFDDQQIDSLTCLGESTDRCEFYYRTGDASDPFSQDSQIRGDAVFDPDDYLGAEPQPLDGSNLPRGYSFSVEYDTKITSLYSAYTGGASVNWFVAIYESDDEGNLGQIEAGPVSPTPSSDNTDFVETNINNETLESGETYTIVQGKPTNTNNDGRPLGWSGPGFNMANLLAENPVGFFKPAAEGKTFRYSLTDANSLEGQSPTLDATERAPRVGFDYEITDTEFVEAEGSVIDFEINPDSLTSGTVDYSVTNTITGNDVTSESTITSPIAYTSLDVTDLDGTWSNCDEGVLVAQATWTDSDGESYTDSARLEVNQGTGCPTWISTFQELVRDQQVGSNYDTGSGVRGFAIEPERPLRVESLDIGMEFSATNGDTDTLTAWGAIYNASGDQPTNIVAQTDTFGPSETNGPGLETYQLQSDAYLAEGQQYILAVGGEAESGVQARTHSGSGDQYILRGEEQTIGYADADINWGNVQDMNIVNNRALRWNTPASGNTQSDPDSSLGSTPSYIVGDSPDITDLSFPPNIGMNYEYLENAP